MELFYCIKIINQRTGVRGYIDESDGEIKVSVDGITVNIKQFKTYQDAQQFIRDNKIEGKGVTAYIRDSNDLIKDNTKGIVKVENDVFSIVLSAIFMNESERAELEEKMKDPNFKLDKEPTIKYAHFDTAKQEYYFDDPMFGALAFPDEKSAKEFMKTYFSDIKGVSVKRIPAKKTN